MRSSTPVAIAAAVCLTLSAAPARSNPPSGRGGKSTSSRPASGTKPTTTSGTPTTSAPTGKNDASTPVINPIAAKIMSKPNLNSKVTAMLPTVNGTKMSLNDASMGFKNQGQFLAALHVSQNLGVAFADLKNAMMTKTGSGATAELRQTGSLGQAIQKVKKNADATAEVEKAETQANGDLTAPPTTKPPKKKTAATGGAQ